MAIRRIVGGGDPLLRKNSRDVTVFDERLHQLLDDMLETLHEIGGVGLAAVQVGALRKVCVIDVGEGVIELINPVIVEQSEETIAQYEGCLSFPGESGYVERPKFVKVQAQDRHGDLIVVQGEDLLARAFCHEIDHMHGIVFKDLATEIVDNEELERREELEEEKPSQEIYWYAEIFYRSHPGQLAVHRRRGRPAHRARAAHDAGT